MTTKSFRKSQCPKSKQSIHNVKNRKTHRKTFIAMCMGMSRHYPQYSRCHKMQWFLKSSISIPVV